MGLLDELEQEAERRRAEQAQAAAERETREQRWNDQLQPAMKALDDYLQRLTRHLAVLEKRARIDYPLPGYGDVVALIEPSWVLQSQPAASSYDITLEGLAVVQSDDCPRIVCDTEARVRSVMSVLQQHQLVGISDARKDANGEIRAATFRARGRVPLLLQVHADLDSGVARMQFTNFEGFGHSSRTFRPEQLDEALFDALGRFLARETSRFAQESVAEDLRKQLQSRLQRDQIKRQWEQKLSRQLAEDEAEVVARLDRSLRPGGVLGRVRLLTRKLLGK